MTNGWRGGLDRLFPGDAPLGVAASMIHPDRFHPRHRPWHWTASVQERRRSMTAHEASQHKNIANICSFLCITQQFFNKLRRPHESEREGRRASRHECLAEYRFPTLM